MHPPRGQFHSECIGQRLKRELAGGVGPAEREHQLAVARTEVDDPAPGATELGQQRLGERLHPEDVDPEDLLEVLHPLLLQRAETGDPGVVHQASQPGLSRQFRDRRGRRVDAPRVGHIEDHRVECRPRLGHQSGAVIRRANPGQDVETMAHQVERHVAPEAPGGAGYQDERQFGHLCLVAGPAEDRAGRVTGGAADHRGWGERLR